jgi:hypothetical protein
MSQWTYTSYNSLLNTKPTKLEREYVLNLFGGVDGFRKFHDQQIELRIPDFEE